MKDRATPNPNPKPPTTLPPPLLKKMTRYYSAPLPACFRPPSTSLSLSPPPHLDYPHAPPSTTTTNNPNLTTCLYETPIGIFSLSWSRSLLSRSLHLSLSSLASFHLSLKPFLFWNKQGIKKLTFYPQPDDPKSIWVFWDFTNARFGSGPEPETGFYIAVLSEGEMTLLVGDLEREAYAKTRALRAKNGRKSQPLVLRREHVVVKNKFYATKIDLGGKSRSISIELNESCEEDPRLVIRFDSKRVIQVKHLKWKFRGSERIEVDGHPIQLSWDVYNWLFEAKEGNNNNQDDGYALFTFRFEKQGNEIELDERREKGAGVVTWHSEDSCGLNYERKKMKKRVLMKNRTRSPSLSSSSLSSASSGCSSVLEWESVEENELKGPTGFSLLIYAWKS